MHIHFSLISLLFKSNSIQPHKYSNSGIPNGNSNPNNLNHIIPNTTLFRQILESINSPNYDDDLNYGVQYEQFLSDINGRVVYEFIIEVELWTIIIFWHAPLKFLLYHRKVACKGVFHILNCYYYYVGKLFKRDFSIYVMCFLLHCC